MKICGRIFGFRLLLLGAAAWGMTPAAPTVEILTSFYPMYIHALNVAGDVPGVRVVNLAPPQTGCLHDYQLTPADMVRITQADILVVNGAGMEAYLDKALRQAPRVKLVDASKGIELLQNAAGEPNPHVWVGISLAIRQVGNIAEGLAAADPAHAAAYRANAAAYAKKLEALRARMQAELAPYHGREIVTFHEAFPYFAREFGLRVAAAIEREPGSEPNARELAATIDLIKSKNIRVLFAEPQYSARAAETIARETGARVRTLDPCVTGPLTHDAYLRAMEANLSVLEEALRP